jgi:hypothetical protein
MSRAVLCCALLAVVAAGCGSTSSTGRYPAASSEEHHRPTMAPRTNAPASFQLPTQQAPGTPYPAVQFPSVGINPYVDAALDSDSTFGLDVDTASYTVVRLAAAALSEKLPQTAEARDFVGMLDQMAGQGW